MISRYNISLIHSFTPVEWFFHVRNIQDELLQLGYRTVDFNDSGENGRKNTLGKNEIHLFSGLVSYTKHINADEVKACIDSYFKERGFQNQINSVQLDKPTEEDDVLAEYLKMVPVTHNEMHYYIEIEPDISPAEWFYHARNLSDALKPKGYTLRDFHDGFVLDRMQILNSPHVNFFEGFAYNSTPIDSNNMHEDVANYLSEYSLTIKNFRT